jgi:hypothetical protein
MDRAIAKLGAGTVGMPLWRRLASPGLGRAARSQSREPEGSVGLVELSQFMSTFLVSFEIDSLASQFRHYGAFVERLNSYPQAARLHYSAWLVRSGDSVQHIAAELEQFMYPEGRLVVASIARDATAWTEVECGSSWLYENLW